MIRASMHSLFAFALAASPGLALPARADESRAVTATRPTRGEVVRFVTLPGRIQANRKATLYAKVSGYLATLTVDQGDRVKAGQLLGTIEVPELQADLSRYEAEARVATSELERISAAREKAPDLVVAQTVDDARGRAEIARAEVQRIRTLLGFARLTAPFRGIVTARFVDPGAFIPAATAGNASNRGAGETANSAAIVTLMDFETVRVQVPVPEREAALVQIGQPLEFTVDVLGPKKFSARVSRHAYAIDAPTQTMHVEADVANADLALRPGIFVTARVGVDRHADVMTLPVAAVLVEKTTKSVFVNAGGVAKKTPVETGFDDGARVEITRGLAGSETVLLPGIGGPLADGLAVRVVEAP